MFNKKNTSKKHSQTKIICEDIYSESLYNPINKEKRSNKIEIKDQEEQTAYRSNNSNEMSSISSDINSVKREISKLKEKNKQIIFDNYIDVQQTQHRKIDADSILKSFSMISSKENYTFDIEQNSTPISLSYIPNELSQDELKLINSYGSDVSIKMLLNEILKKNLKICKVEKDLELANSKNNINRDENERKYVTLLNEYNELKEKYEKDFCENEVIKEKMRKENEKLEKEKKFLVEQVIKLRYVNNIIKNKQLELFNEISEKNKSLKMQINN